MILQRCICLVFLSIQTSRVNTIKLRTSTVSALDTTSVRSVRGQRTSLPCDLTPPHQNETVYLVLWYKEDQGEPLYSYDAREYSWNLGTRWSDEFTFGDRAYFDLSQSPAALLVERIKKAEAGVYRCRVDFKSAPTRNTLVNVTLIEPPSSVTIIDYSGAAVEDTAGPYQLDTILTLTCVSSGGDPSPAVTWWRENELVDSSYERTYSHVVQNSLKVGPLSARDLGSVYTCTSSNNNISTPVSRQVTIDMVFPPTDVSITTLGQPLSAGTTYVLSCEAAGSRPDPVISWWLASSVMEEDKMQMVEKVREVTRSTIYFTPTTADHGKLLSCRAENPQMIDSGIDDSWSLTVYYPPRVKISFGVKLDGNNIKEGQDVLFRCDVEANPKAYKIGWRHKNETVVQDIGRGVLISGNSLVLQSVSRDQAGDYSCHASNLEGDTTSSIIKIEIRYRPVCSTASSRLGANIGSQVRPLCSVLASPPPHSFKWTFNNSAQSFTVPGDKFQQNGVTSRLSHSVRSELDYGEFYCWASNTEGEADQPCVYQVIPATVPHPPRQCRVDNQTIELLEISCIPGFDGGLEQVFLLEVLDGLTMSHLANVSSLTPQFTVTGLTPGQEINLVIKAVNSNGPSPSVVMDVFTTKVAQLQVESPVPLQFTPFLGILAGIIVTLIILILTVIIVIKIKYKYGKELNSSRSSGNSETESSESSHYKSFKFDSEKNFVTPDSFHSDSSQSDSPVTALTESSERGSSVCGSGEASDKSHRNPLGERGGRMSVSHCDQVSSWTPFLARNSAESVI